MFQSGELVQPTHPSSKTAERLITPKSQTRTLYRQLPSTFCYHRYSYQHLETLDKKPSTQNMTMSKIVWLKTNKQRQRKMDKVHDNNQKKLNCSPWGPAADTRPSSSKLLTMIPNGVTFSAHATEYLKTKTTKLHLINLPNHTKIRGSLMKTRGIYIQYHSMTRTLNL